MWWTSDTPEHAAQEGCAEGFTAARPAVCTIMAMACDQELAGRIRQLIGDNPELIEKKMFGGIAFLIRGNMAIAASSPGGAFCSQIHVPCKGFPRT
jgi:hypothetical protein